MTETLAKRSDLDLAGDELVAEDDEPFGLGAGDAPAPQSQDEDQGESTGARGDEVEERTGDGTIRLVIVDDHPIVREGLQSIVASEADMTVVGQFTTAEEALDAMARLQPDVAIVDVRLPKMSGVDACGLVLRRHPHVRVILLTSFPSEGAMVAALSYGAHGFLVKESDPSLLRQAVRAVAQGGTFIDPRIASKLVSRVTKTGTARGPFGLTLQEMRVLALLPGGLSNSEIGKELGVSESTVKTHVRNLMAKLRVQDRAQAASIAVREGLA